MSMGITIPISPSCASAPGTRRRAIRSSGIRRCFRTQNEFTPRRSFHSLPTIAITIPRTRNRNAAVPGMIWRKPSRRKWKRRCRIIRSIHGSPPPLGFTTRGCPRNCRWCVVPRKEGMIRPVDDIERIAAGRREVILMDNNFLAAPREFVKEQLEKACAMNLKIDFNQGLDARLIDDRNAAWLARCRWCRFIRLSCDSDAMSPRWPPAVRMLRRAGFSREIFVYVLAEEVGNALSRIERLVALDPKIVPFCQPFRDIGGTGEVMNPELKRLARWCNRVKLRKSCTFAEFRK